MSRRNKFDCCLRSRRLANERNLEPLNDSLVGYVVFIRQGKSSQSRLNLRPTATRLLMDTHNRNNFELASHFHEIPSGVGDISNSSPSSVLDSHTDGLQKGEDKRWAFCFCFSLGSNHLKNIRKKREEAGRIDKRRLGTIRYFGGRRWSREKKKVFFVSTFLVAGGSNLSRRRDAPDTTSSS